ncbi:hypothetical protein F5J12DRAFT_524260 [Pisolithus orientalis]|uniref:uncharacterized protein n=1 Tax=Pisolithus orientalis TaxID=936130 RepID=UPI002223EEE4|nr:uncharacterized protein F5J12DRAFT_524260 [Pisolithus orientalis]KAI6015273.1 hypothetical protein F5J12DRAFT_524260 [Pisolithus orientalis]
MASTTMATHTPIMSAATTITPTSPRPSLSLDVQHPRPSISTLLPDRTHSQSSRRVSSESQRTSHGRASPSPRSTSRRTPVPALLDSFPIPPSHIPPSPATPVSPSIPGSFFGPSSSTPGPSGTHPPLTSPPPAPLPPVPGPSSVLLSDLLMTRRSLQTARPASPAGVSENPPRKSADGQGRPRKGSLSSLRNTAYCAVTHDRGQGEVIQEDPGVEGEHGSQCPPQSAPARALSPPASVTPSSPPSITPLGAGDESTKLVLPLETTVTLVPAIARPSASRKPSAGTSMPLSDNTYGEDSIASIDMSDLSALKSDNEGDGDELRTCLSFPPVPPIPHSVGSGKRGPLYAHTPRKPSKASISSVHVFPISPTDRNAMRHVGDVDKNDNGEQNRADAHNDIDRNDAQFRSRSTSPDLSQIISLTPRPRKRSTPSHPRSRTSSLGRERALSVRSRKSSDALPPPVPKLSPTRTRTGWGNFGARGEGQPEGETGAVLGEDDDAYGSDSSIDLHTPLPHLMLRHGMLSPNSKLLPQPSVDSLNRMSMVSDVSNLSYFSNASNVSLASTSSKHPKDSRDTPRRRTRHRDGKLLKGGIGLTTGLGWSDSEDEDAPSPLTRRLSRIVLSRSTSASSFHSSRSSHSQPCLPHPLSRSISHSVLREADEYEGAGESVADCIPSTIDEFGHSSGVTSRSLPSRSGSRAGTVSISRSGSTYSTTSGSGSRYSNYSTMSAPAAGLRMRTNSSSSSYEPVGRTNSFSRENGYGLHGLAVSIPEQDDGVTPTRAAFDRASLGAVKGGSGNGTQGGDQPHTPSSTTSSTSLSFPATPESTDGVQPQHIDDRKSGHGGEATPSAVAWNKDKSLPPLPYPAVTTANSNSASSKGKYPPSLGLRAPSVVQRPRTYSNSSSVSTKSALAASNADGNTSRGPSPAPINAPATPSAGGTSIPRPSLGIPRPSLSTISPASKSRPSLTLPSSAPISTATSPLATSPVTNGSMAGISQGQSPRPLRLVPSRSATPSSDPIRSQSPFLSRMPNRNVKKALQPGEQLPRPGQILTYNRNVHDQLKLRSLSTSSGVSNAKIGPVSPGGTQTLLLASQSETSGLGISPGSSPLSSPVTGESPKPKPRTGTGMTYRTNGTSRMRMPSTTSR